MVGRAMRVMGPGERVAGPAIRRAIQRPTGVAIGLATGLAAAALMLSGCSGDDRPALVFVPDSLPAANTGIPYEERIVVERTVTPVGGAFLGAGALPDGLILELLPGQTDTIRISGTPTQPGMFTFTVSVWCFGTNVSGQTGDREYTITVR